MLETTLLFIGGIGPIEVVLLLLFAVVPFTLWLWAIIDLLLGNFSENTTKLIWLVVVAFIPFLGAILYLLIGRRQKVRTIN
ncbi:PLD nuclease N-terminal domain-containing protein [Pontibacter fetidus]|uniref:PLDc_N domain-containing protein n=1 Tax=Pontibacter fetidus TaxID=2700082 RepID=A0A6B2H3D0_9BACT|nr:PLDc_N domain-containing protein [Pontibacter fetidus]